MRYRKVSLIIVLITWSITATTSACVTETTTITAAEAISTSSTPAQQMPINTTLAETTPISTTTPAPPANTTTPAPPANTTIRAPPANTTTQAPPANTTTQAPPANTTTPAPPANTTTQAPPANTRTPAPPANTTTPAPPANTTQASNTTTLRDGNDAVTTSSTPTPVAATPVGTSPDHQVGVNSTSPGTTSPTLPNNTTTSASTSSSVTERKAEATTAYTTSSSAPRASTPRTSTFTPADDDEEDDDDDDDDEDDDDIEEVKPPVLERAPPTLFVFTLRMVQLSYYSDLEDAQSPSFKELAQEIEININTLFIGCPGYRENSIKVKRFRKGSVIADYDVAIEPQAVLTRSEDVRQYIADQVYANITHLQINGSSISAEGMKESVTQQILTVRQNPCSVVTDSVCDSCYRCANSSTSANASVSCRFGCDANSKRCAIIDTKGSPAKFNCICRSGYLPVGSDCVHESVIIGASVAAGAAALVILIIALVVVGCKYYKKSKKYKDLEERRHSSSTDDPELIYGYERTGTKTTEAEQHEVVSSVNDGSSSVHRSMTAVDRNESTDAQTSAGSEYAPPAEVTETEAYINFAPQLLTVDTIKQYVIRRPAVSQEPVLLSYKDGSNYNSKSFF